MSIPYVDVVSFVHQLLFRLPKSYLLQNANIQRWIHDHNVNIPDGADIYIANSYPLEQMTNAWIMTGSRGTCEGTNAGKNFSVTWKGLDQRTGITTDATTIKYNDQELSSSTNKNGDSMVLHDGENSVTVWLDLGMIHVQSAPEPERVSSAMGGDPFLFPVDGPPVKLPNTPGRYRMFQHRAQGTYMDIMVDRIHVRLPVTGSWCRPVQDGFYVTGCTIHHGGVVDTVDLRTPHCFQREELPWSTTLRKGRSDETSAELGGIILGTYTSRTLRVGNVGHVEIRVYDNPQILNGLIWSVPPRVHDKVDGLLYRNYRPTLFRSGGKRIGTPFITLPPKGRLLCQRPLSTGNDVPTSIYQPRLFNLLHQ